MRLPLHDRRNVVWLGMSSKADLHAGRSACFSFPIVLHTKCCCTEAAQAARSEADRDAVHVSMANEAVCIGPARAQDSYLRGDRVLEVSFAFAIYYQILL